MSNPLLKLENIGIQFGGLKAVQNVNMYLNKGELVGLIGPNGAGKTTTFNMLTGVYVPTEGEITFNGQSIKGLKPYQVSHKGISRTFQNIRLFKDLTVLDNVKIANHQLAKHSILSSILRLPTHFKGEATMEKESIEFLKIFELDVYKDELAKNLPYGMQRRLEIARALAAGPKLLLLDEPAAGMTDAETHQTAELLKEINKERSVVVVEHDMVFVRELGVRVTCLHEGSVLAEGSLDQVAADERVIEVYLGR